MTTFPIHGKATLDSSFNPLARIVAAVSLMFEIFEDAQALARAAHKRYPFAES